MPEIIILKNSPSPGKIPKTKDLQFGELAVNTNSGTIFSRRSNKIVDEIVSFNSDIATSQKLDIATTTHFVNFDVQNRQQKEITLREHTRIQFVNLPADGTIINLTLFINNTNDFAVSWQNSIIWQDGIAPCIENKSWTIIEIIISGNSKIFGILKATNLKEAQ